VTNPAGSNPELLVSMDPPRHTRVRALMATAFGPRTVERIEPRIREIAGGLLDEVTARGRPADLVPLLAQPLPIMVICELLGVPHTDRAQIREWAGILIAETAHTHEEIATAIGQVDAYLAKLIAQRREDPDDALISALIAVNDQGRHLSASELVSNVQLLLIAGHETTVSQIGNCVITLLRHPDQITVDELLRHSKLISSTMPRVATEDTVIGDTPIRAGEAVIPLIATANRDPGAFPDPDRFDITRTSPAPHLGFGHGPHYCPLLPRCPTRQARTPSRHSCPVQSIPHPATRDQPGRPGLEGRPVDPLRARTPRHLVTEDYQWTATLHSIIPLARMSGWICIRRSGGYRSTSHCAGYACRMANRRGWPPVTVTSWRC